MNWLDTNVLLHNTTVEVGANASEVEISEEFTLDDPLHLAVDIVASSVTVTNSITVTLQTKSGSTDWIDSKTAAILGNGVTSLTLLAEVTGDQDYLPVRKRCRLVIDTGASDAADIDAVVVTKGENA